MPLCGINHNEFKSYMDYRAVTNVYSKQYKLINSGIFNKDNGLLMTNDGYVAIALGSRFGDIGDKFIISLDTGKKFKAIKADEKDDGDTSHRCHHISDGSLIEFIVDVNKLEHKNNLAYIMGDISYIDGFGGNIVSIEMEV